MMDWGGGMGGGAWLFMSVFWILLIVAVVWAVASLFPAARRPDALDVPERPEEILDRRLARGEIDAATYDELRARLSSARAQRV